MNWKSVFIIYSEVEVCNLQTFFEDCQLRVDNLPEGINISDDNKHFKLLTVISGAQMTDVIEEVYLKSINLVEKFLGRVSLLGYCATQIVNHMITTLERCNIGSEFEVLSTDIMYNKFFRESITLDDLGTIENHEQYLETALSFLRRALSTNSLEEKIIMLASCLEKIGSEESEEYTVIICGQCGHQEITKIKATKKFLRNVLRSKGATNAEIANFLDRDRNKIAHGGGKRDVQFYSDLKESVLKIQSLVVEIVNDRLKANMVNASTSVIDLPVAIYKFVRKENGSFELTDENSIRFHSMAGVSKVKNTNERAQKNFIFEIGVKTDSSNSMLNIDFQNLFFPQVLLA